MALRISPQLRAILWVQWRSLWSLRRSGGLGRRALAGGAAAFWYALWAVLATAAAAFASDPSRVSELRVLLPWGMLLIFIYWQAAPILTAGLGASLNLSKLLLYPISERQLFRIEVLLRLTTGMEMLLILGGLTVGLLENPAVRSPGAPVAVLVFVAFNLFVAAGVKNLLARLAARRHVREIFVFLVVIAVALPQLLAVTGVPPAIRRLVSGTPRGIWPWAAAGHLASGSGFPGAWLVLCAWTAAAWVFARGQFQRELRAGALQAAVLPAARGNGWADAAYRLPGWFLSDPLAALVEKELRSLFRTARFRLVFIMGFTFGFLVWLPLLKGYGQSRVPADLPMFVSMYALLLLAEVVFWNTFGFDRSAAQLYFSAPVPFAKVLVAKNIAAGLLVLLEVTVVIGVSLVLRIPLHPGKIGETYAVVAVFAGYLLATGNLSSVHYPRAVEPEHTWGHASAGKFQALLMLLFPVLGFPLVLAYGARYAFESEVAFYLVLAVAAVLGAVYYWVALDSAVSAAEEKKERLLATLGQGSGPLGA